MKKYKKTSLGVCRNAYFIALLLPPVTSTVKLQEYPIKPGYAKYSNDLRKIHTFPSTVKLQGKHIKNDFCDKSRTKTSKFQVRKKNVKKQREFPCHLQSMRPTQEITHIPTTIFCYKTRVKTRGTFFATPLVKYAQFFWRKKQL